MTTQIGSGESTIGPVGPNNPILDIIKMAQEGASVAELQVVIAQNMQWFQSQSDETAGFLWNLLEDSNFQEAFTAASFYGEEVDNDLGSLLFGDPDATTATGTAMGPGGPLLKGVSSIRHLDKSGNVIKEVIKQNPSILSSIRNFLTGKPGSGLTNRLLRTSLTGAVGISAFSGLEGTDPQARDEQGNPVNSPTAPGNQVVDRTFDPNNMNRGAYRGVTGSTAPGGATPQNFGGYNPGAYHPAEQGFNVMIVDRDGSLTGTPGAVAIVSQNDLGIKGDPVVQDLISQSLPPGSDPLAMLTSVLSQTNAQGLAATQGPKIYGTLFPQSVNVIGFDTPVAITAQKGAVYTSEKLPNTGSALLERLPVEETGAKQVSAGSQNVNIPAGAQISPRAFETFNGRTLLEWASIAAQKHGVPVNLLYGIVQHESGWLKTAIGDNGNSFGLAQIYMPSWQGQVTQAQALNPVFALNWTAQKLRQRFTQYGRWDAAVAAHNKPVAAEHLAKTGQFLDEKSANYVGSVLDKANKSGLANYLFETGEDVPITSQQPSGPRYTPFQAPDPAASRQFVMESYQDMLGRKPTEAEIKAGVDKILGLSKSSYQAELTKAKGGTSEAVDVGARFQEDIEGLGEYAFHEEVTNQRNFTDFAAGIARMLQQGV